jgi:hypothetical protein
MERDGVPEGDIIHVKPMDGSPPDPDFDTMIVYTIGDDPTEFGYGSHTETIQGRSERELQAFTPSQH